MALNGSPVLIASFAALAATAMTTPVTPGETGLGASNQGVGAGSERTTAHKRATLVVSRPGGDGQIAVYGALLPDPLSGAPLGNSYCAVDSSTTPGNGKSAVLLTPTTIAQNANGVPSASALLDATATTATQPATIAAGVPTNLHVVVLNGVILRCSSSPAAGTSTTAPENTFTITAGVITLYAGATGSWTGATGIPAGSEMVEYYVAAPQQVLAAGANLTAYTGVLSKKILFVTAPVAVTAGTSVVTLAHAVD